MRRHFFVVSALVLFALPVMADAPVGQYSPFVRDTDTIHDTKTLLDWQRPPDAPNVTPSTRVFKTFVAAPTVCPVTPAGYRLPTVKELLTLVDEAPHKEYENGRVIEKAIDQAAFGSSTGADAPYWTQTPSDQVGKNWGVHFKDGTLVRLKIDGTDSAYVRCVK